MKLIWTIYGSFVVQFFFNPACAQICIELPDMNGTSGSYVSPTNWNIWYSSPDIISGNGTYPGTAIANINDVNGLSLAGGEMVFLLINGALGTNTEGITTQLSGLTPGTTYFVAVQWQQVTLDYIGISADPTGGKLGIYLDGTLYQIYSSNDGVNDVWQTATIIFVASSTSHLLGLKGELLENSSRGAIVVDNLPCPIFLGLDIVQFDVQATGNSLIELTWELADDFSYDYLEIERSEDLMEWTKIARIDQANQHYFLDQDPIDGQSYYRLKEVDFDGEFNYSEIRSVDISLEQTAQTKVVVYPNPSRDYVAVSGVRASDISLLDVSGRIIDHSSFVIFESDHTVQLDVSSLIKGAYFLQTTESVVVFIKE